MPGRLAQGCVQNVRGDGIGHAGLWNNGRVHNRKTIETLLSKVHSIRCKEYKEEEGELAFFTFPGEFD